MVSTLVQRLLVERSCHRTVHFIVHGQFDGFDNRHKSRMSALWRYHTWGECIHVDAVEVEHINGTQFKLCFIHTLYAIDFQVEAHLLHGPFHHVGITCHQRTAFVVGFLHVERLHDNLRSNACRVAHGNGKNRFHIIIPPFINKDCCKYPLHPARSPRGGCSSAVAAHSWQPWPCHPPLIEEY